MPLEETLLNARLAHRIRDLTRGLGWNIQEEARGSLDEGPLKKPDIVIRRDGASPIVIENEYLPAATLERECIDRLGYTVLPSDGHDGGKVAVVFGIRSPRELRECNNSDEADAMLRDGSQLEYAVYAPKNSKWARFPERGFIQGDIRNLVEFMKPASVPQDEVDRAAGILAGGAETAATVLVRDARRTDFGVRIGEMLRQPWPKYAGMPQTRKEIIQERADEEARLQTARMCAVILINALAYQQNLANHQDDIQDIVTAVERRGANQLTKRVVMEEWDRILRINYWPIFHIARQLLIEVPNNTALEIFGPMVAVADEIQSAMRQHDVAGIVFQRLIADRKTLKTYYTLPASTVLAANLGVHEDRDWSDPDVVKDYRIADYACGTGGLVLAAYQRVRDLHRGHGGAPDELHSYMMEHSLTACDIMPAAVHLSSSLLSSVAPNRSFDGTRSILYPFGGRKKRDSEGKVRTDRKGNPVMETDGKGRLVVDIGSLVLLDVNAANQPIVLPINEEMALGANGKRNPIEVGMAPMNDDLVIMNPPFTRPTKHAPLNASGHVDPKNPAFAAFGTSDDEQRAMKKKERELGRNTISDGNAGLGTTFTAIAHNMVRPGGRIALILPTSAMMGGSFDQTKNQAYSWQRLRNLLNAHYDQIVVVSIAEPLNSDSAFSADSNFADCIVIAQRADGPVGTNRIHFVNLKTRPRTMLEAQEVARATRLAIRRTTDVGAHSEINIGEDTVGFVRLDIAARNRKWTAIRTDNPTLYERVRQLSSGNLSLPRRAGTTSIPVARMGSIGRVGPIARDITESNRGPFKKRDGAGPGTEFPMLWNHAPQGNDRSARLQNCILTAPDTHGIVKELREQEAVQLWNANASNLHISVLVGFNSNATVAAWTDRKSLGGRVWPTLTVDSEKHEKALCVWLNSTLGVMIYWIDSNRSQTPRGQSSATALPNMPVLDVRELSQSQLDAAVTIFEDLKASAMLPANEAYRDPVRQELDRRMLMEVLGLDDAAVEQLAILRNQWCAEPTVTGTKRTGIMYNS